MAMRVGRNEERQLCGDVDVDSTCGDFAAGASHRSHRWTEEQRAVSVVV